MKNLKLSFAVPGVALLLAGCAGQVVDKTPVVDVSVIKASIRTSGPLLPDATQTTVRYTAGNKSTLETKTEYDSWITSKIAGDNHTAEITRLDKNLLWQVNYSAENYAECPLAGCSSLSPLEQLKNEGSDDEDTEDYNPAGSDSCKVEVKKFDFTVTPKAKGREINGFIADQYVAQWDLVSEDDQGNRDKHTVTMDYWMADVSANQALKESHDFDQKYYDKVIAETPLARLLDQNMEKVLAFFSAGKENEMKKLTSVNGEPISVKLEWYADINACQEAETKKDDPEFDAKDPVNSLKDMAGSFFSEQAEKGAKKWMGMEDGKPLVTYIREVTAANMSGEHTSRFEVPKDFKLIDRQ
ncbi:MULTISPECIES: hypothetical protein [Marinomonas]|uniref:Lipoprotein n=1 Tax=Marinomonas alcarazii TaxID=491949 RepID=A0A318VLG9_9GAMM|nr:MULTISPECIES: hypothetical protein [Marinomonas]PYF84539.1 hypothetical protein DFP75_101577 [Marinomonas alcarazii]